MNKGFTVIELLAVLVIISLLMVMAVPSYTSVYNDIKRNNYLNKVSYIKTSAYKYAESIKDEIKDNKCINTNVKELIRKGFLTSEDNRDDVLINPVNYKPMKDKINICYCNSTFDLMVNYVLDFDEKKSYLPDDVVMFNNKLYKCYIKYNNNGGIYATKDGKTYFREIEC